MKQHILLLVCATSMITGCGEEDFTDLHQYITEVKLRPKEPIKSLPEPKNVVSFVFRPEDLRDPFKAIKPTEIVETDPRKTITGGIRPDTSRRKEELEAFPLESLKMIGTINMKSQLWGLVRSSDRTVYRVRIGNYMGQNYGKIIRVSPDRIELMEIVPDQPGTWREQQMSLMLADDQEG